MQYMLLTANMAGEQEAIVTAITIVLLIFTRLWCTPTHVQSKPDRDIAL